EERYCLVCPEDAMAVGPLGQVIISPTMCTLCEACEKACPIGAIEIFEKLVYVCDLCGGKPKCVDACTERAIEFVTGDKKAPSLSAIKKETSKMSPGQKRKHYLTKSGASLRKRWTQRHA
ncbi:MAG: 4Fe-4S binding protein, partial [Candidatus Aminicenantales bacterium]